MKRPGFLNELWQKLMRVGIKDEVYVFFENFSALLGSGVGVEESLRSLQQDAVLLRMRKFIGIAKEEVHRGVSLSKALQNAGLVNARMYTLVSAGETSGNLVKNLKLLVLQNKKEHQFRSKIRSSLLYALTVSIVAIVVMLLTSLYILPQLADFYAQLDVELPWLTRVLIATGSFMAAYGFILLPVVIVMVLIALYFLFSFPRTKFIGHSILFHLPVLRKLLKYSEVSRFGFLMGSELSSGISIMQALINMQSATTFKNYQRFYAYLARSVESGKTLRESFDNYPHVMRLFPAQSITMIGAGERSGTLAVSLERLGDMFEERVDTIAKNLPTLLEPLIIVIVGIFIGIIALATILPIYSLSDSF